MFLATGAKTNFFGNEAIEKNSMQMKSAPDALFIRNRILRNFEKALNKASREDISTYLNVAIIGGGPTGVELAGAVAEMRKYVLPKDYPELDMSNMKIMLFEASPGCWPACRRKLPLPLKITWSNWASKLGPTLKC